jgi:hypothetical protein
MDLSKLHSNSKYQVQMPFHPDSDLDLNRKDIENFLILKMVISTPRYDKRFRSYDFLKLTGLLRFWADQI